MATVLHVGVDVRNLRTLHLVCVGRVTVTGDGWEAWGDAVGTAANDDCTLHAVLDLNPIDAGDVVLGIADVLVAMHGSIVAVETQDDEWDLHEAGGRVWHRVHVVGGVPTYVVEHIRGNPSS